MSNVTILKVKEYPTDKDHIWTVSVKSEFLLKCPDPENYGMFDLNTKFFLYSFLHNENEPAIVRNDGAKIKDNPIQWWIEGKCINYEDPAKAIELQKAYDKKMLTQT